ncbi:sodium channel protein type 4 subunit alpha-like [Convolutriloba macropyga]|uniref:sodium channel protein type 4 subunit alpha-like n=1 Tax=Convolutriloba macropyga TaxID=536237 RepID=UPI003F520437
MSNLLQPPSFENFGGGSGTNRSSSPESIRRIPTPSSMAGSYMDEQQAITRERWPLAISKIRMSGEERQELGSDMLDKMDWLFPEDDMVEDSTDNDRQESAVSKETTPDLEDKKIKFDPALVDGAELPKDYLPFPPDLLNIPLEELDPLRTGTFVVICEKMGRLVINRYGTGNSLFVIPPTSMIRNGCIYILSSQWFEVFITICILINGFFLGIEANVYFLECLFQFLYTCEMIMNVVARGFIIGRKCYLHDIWNIIDFSIIVFSYVYFVFELLDKEEAFAVNLQALRAVRILRAFKTLSAIKGLRKIINALLKSIRNLMEVLLLSGFIIFVTAVVCIQLFGGVLRNKCVMKGFNENNGTWEEWIQTPSSNEELIRLPRSPRLSSGPKWPMIRPS